MAGLLQGEPMPYIVTIILLCAALAVAVMVITWLFLEGE